MSRSLSERTAMKIKAMFMILKNHVSTDYFAKFLKSLKQPGDIRSNRYQVYGFNQ